MTNFYVEAYDKNGREILGTLDGQGAYPAINYKRRQWYKALPYFRTLNNKVKYYLIKDLDGSEIEKVLNQRYIAALKKDSNILPDIDTKDHSFYNEY